MSLIPKSHSDEKSLSFLCVMRGSLMPVMLGEKKERKQTDGQTDKQCVKMG